MKELLLIDDNESDARLARHAFAKLGAEQSMLHLRDGGAALDYLFRRGPFEGLPFESLPKLILLDLKLPVVCGREVLRALKADPKLRQIPVVILTASSQESDLTECYRVGANSYLQKPIDFEAFEEIAKTLVQYWLRFNRTAGREGVRA
ncbi:MAG: response regulator [Myxococcota bacterium]